MPVSRDHAQAFLDSLWPCGDMAHLATHPRTFLSGAIGKVPQSLVSQKWGDEDSKAASAALVTELRELADAIERGLDEPAQF